MIKIFHAQNRLSGNLPLVNTNSGIPVKNENLYPTALMPMSIEDDFGYSIIEKGVYYADHQFPSASDYTASSLGGNTGTPYIFPSVDLDFETTYYFRGFAKTIKGLGLGPVESFITGDGTPLFYVRYEGVSGDNAIFGYTLIQYYLNYPTAITSVKMYVSIDPDPYNDPNAAIYQFSRYDSVSQADLPFEYEVSFGAQLTPGQTYYMMGEMVLATGPYQVGYSEVISFVAA